MIQQSAHRLIRALGLADRPATVLPSLAEVEPARQYIQDYWKVLRRSHPYDEGDLIGLPHPYLVSSYAPEHDFDFNELYYWDSYMMAQGLIGTGRPEDQRLVEGMLDDLVYLVRRYGMVPNASRTYLTGKSQPPFLTSFIFDVYDAYGKDDEWLRLRISLAQQEYDTVWMGTQKPHQRQVLQGLSRYATVDLTHEQAETESGWDYTPRFQRRCLDHLPVDLNALLYKYETDFARAARILGEETEHGRWRKLARRRKSAMNKLMWDRYRGLFYDYDFVRRRRSPVSSLAAYYCMWSGLATHRQAKAMVRALRRFEHQGGLTTTDDIPFSQRLAGGQPTQWAYPNGWAPLHLLVVQGLERYGFRRDAKRIVGKWLRTNLSWFEEHGNFIEKYNVVEPGKPPARGVYPSQTGFGWTNAIFERFYRDYLDH